VEVTSKLDSQNCIINSQLQRHVNKWLLSTTGEQLPTGLKPYDYIVAGLDGEQRPMNTCGCGHTFLYGNYVYINGDDCGGSEHVLLHEMGHCFGLCDEYSASVWESQNTYYYTTIYDTCPYSKCPNTKPTPANGCSNPSSCWGKWANTAEDNFYNIMGTANIPPSRRVSTESRAVIEHYLCTLKGIC